jgi:drug/metabolite transporter (DMT)-like permease
MSLFRRAPGPHRHTSTLDVEYEPPVPPGEKRRSRLIIALILASVVLAATAQLLLKVGMNRVGAIGTADLDEPLATALRVLRQPTIWAGIVAFGLSGVIWLVVLSRTALSFAYPFASLTFVLILVFEWALLNEPFFALRWGGVAFIIMGLILVSRTGTHT